MKIRFAILLSVFTIFCLVLVCRWRNANWDRLPKIDNPKILQKDCLNLYQEFPFQKFSVEIPKAKWAASIVNLHPRIVYNNFDGVFIITATDINNKPFLWHSGEVYQAWMAEGFFIRCNQTSSVPESANSLMKITPTQFDDIYEFYEFPAIQ